MGRRFTIAFALVGSIAGAAIACSSFSGSTANEGDASDENTGETSVNDGAVSKDAGTSPDATFDATPPFPCDDAGVCTMAMGFDHPSSIAVDDNFVYITESVTQGRVMAIPKAGGAPKLIFTGNVPRSVRATPSAVYFGVHDDNVVYIGNTTTHLSIALPYYLEADDAGLIVAQNQEVLYSLPPSLDGSFMFAGQNSPIMGLSLTSQNVYVSYMSGQVQIYTRADFKNVGIFDPNPAFNGPTALYAVSDNEVYLIEVGASRIVELDSTNLAANPLLIIDSLDIPTGLTVDTNSKTLFVVEVQTVSAVDLVSHGKKPLIVNTQYMNAITQDANYLYVLVEGASADGGGEVPKSGYVLRVAK